MTTSSAEIRNRIADIEKKQRAAAEAERQRLEAENANRLTIAATEKELAELRHAEAVAQIAEYKAAGGPVMAAWQTEVDALYARLEAPDLKLSEVTPALLAGVGSAYNRQVEHSEIVAGLIQQLAEENWESRRAALTKQYGNETLADRAFQREADSFRGQHLAGMKSALKTLDVLAMWVNRAPSDAVRHMRIGVVYMLTGYFNDPNREFIPSREFVLPRYR